MRKTKIGPVFCQQFDKACIVGKNLDWPAFDFSENALMKVSDLIGHERRLANMLTNAKHGP